MINQQKLAKALSLVGVGMSRLNPFHDAAGAALVVVRTLMRGTSEQRRAQEKGRLKEEGRKILNGLNLPSSDKDVEEFWRIMTEYGRLDPAYKDQGQFLKDRLEDQ